MQSPRRRSRPELIGVAILCLAAPVAAQERDADARRNLGDLAWTLGEAQFKWLERTLSASTAPFKFVFTHHLVGGSFDGLGRGGVEFAPYFEWGGSNTNGTPGFAAHRPGWSRPIQSLLLANGVSAVFHGHDHLYVKQDLDADGDGVADLVYQEVPQPSRTNYGAIGAGHYIRSVAPGGVQVTLEDGSPDVVGLRDRALIGVMVFSFARVGAAVTMKAEDYYAQGKRWWFRLHEKGGKRHDEGLGKNDSCESAERGHAHGDGRFILAVVYGAESAAYIFRLVGSVI